MSSRSVSLRKGAGRPGKVAATHHDVLGVVRAHPLVRHLRHGRHRRVEAVKMPVQGTVVARDNLAPARDLDADLAAQRRGAKLGRTLERCGRPAALVAEDVEPLRVFEPMQVALLGEASPAGKEDAVQKP
jgi:hypothetical protein